MKTKILYLILLSLITIYCSSCNKWLDVSPENRISDEKLFSEASGVRNALNGIYQQISDQSLFGREFTWGLYSSMGQDYRMEDIAAVYRYIAHPTQRNFQQTSVINLRRSIWSTAYNAIANCNKLINEVRALDPGVFPLDTVEKNLILGEAMAIRALLHFELVRLYAPSPKVDLNGAYIPYVDVYPAYHTPQLSTQKVFEKIVDDLTNAKDLVSESDTSVNRVALSDRIQSQLGGGNAPPGGLFFNYRMSRLNFVAINALLARAYLYAGDIQNAKTTSEYVYANFGPSGRLNWYLFTTEANSTGANKYHKLADDILFATYDPDMVQKINTHKGTSYRYRINSSVSTWFPSGQRDYRFNLLSPDAQVPSDFVSDKWRESTSTATYRRDQNQIAPVIRMSEMFLIHAETLYETGEINEALRVLNILRNGRGILNTFSDGSKEGFYQELLSEYRREFLTEGQTVFAFKRRNESVKVGAQIIPMDQWFTLEIPDEEFVF